MKKVFIFLIFISLILKADIKIDAYFSAEKAGTEDIVDFIINIEGEGGNIATPYISSNEDFNVLSGPSVSTSVQIINFNMKKSTEYRWRLNPKREGILIMPPIEIKIGKEIYKTKEAKIEVQKGSILKRERRQTPSIFDDFFEERRDFKPREVGVRVQAVPNKTECYVGEPIVITYNLLVQTVVHNINMVEPPVYDGFWVEKIELPENTGGKNIEFEGKQFILYTIKKDLLFPNSEGIKKIKEVTFQIQAITQRDIFGFGNIENLLRKTSEITIKVKPLPEPPFSSFKGAVGKFELSAKTDKVEVEEGEAFTLALKLSGKGNFKNISNIDLPEIPLCKVYPPKIEEKLKATSEGYEGFKIWEWVIIPEEKQSLKIPQISFSYFDPYKKDYSEIKTPLLSVFIKKGKEKKEEKIIMAEGKQIKEIGKDIGFIIVDGKNLKKKEKNNNFFYYLFLLPVIINLSLFIIRKIKERGLSEKEKFEKEALNYFKKANQSLKLKDEEEFVKNVEKALKVSISGNPDLTLEEFNEKISNLPEDEKDKINSFINLLQDFRFNPLFKEKKNLEEIEKEGKIWLQKLKKL